MSLFQKKMFSDAVRDSLDKVNSVVKSFDHVVIMPGGEAFKFTGLDTDEEGAVYSHLTYQAGTSAALQKVASSKA